MIQKTSKQSEKSGHGSGKRGENLSIRNITVINFGASKRLNIWGKEN